MEAHEGHHVGYGHELGLPEVVIEADITDSENFKASSDAEMDIVPLDREDFDPDDNYDDEHGLEMDYTPDDTEFAPFERENAFDYRPGGFHPVALGDFLGPDQRFKVVSKIGHGGFATVWLCRDTRENSWRAVKIMKADNSNEDECSELSMTKVFADMDRTTLEQNHIVLPRDHFHVDGPNGRHLCLVLPLLACPIKDAWFKNGGNAAWRKEIGHQLVRAVAFLHGRGVCHGDLRPANILLKPRGLDLLSEEELTALIGKAEVEAFPDHEGILRGDHTPTHLYADSCLDLDAEYMSSEIAVIDFGVAFRTEEAPAPASIPFQYAAPEVLLSGAQPGHGIDLWSLGCTLFELSVDRAPFESEFRGIHGLVEDMEEALGPLPEPYRSAWTETGNKIHGKDHLLPDGYDLPMVSMTPDDLRERQELRVKNMGSDDMLLARLTQETIFYVDNGRLNKDVDEVEGLGVEAGDAAPAGYDRVVNRIAMDEARQLKDLLLQLWRYTPGERATAESLLGHGWFEGRQGQRRTTTATTASSGWALSHILPYLSLSAIAELICMSRKPSKP